MVKALHELQKQENKAKLTPNFNYSSKMKSAQEIRSLRN